ncbi:hypothetical protein ACWEF9_38815, partial [Streptomyces sp. NPDC004980]
MVDRIGVVDTERFDRTPMRDPAEPGLERDDAFAQRRVGGGVRPHLQGRLEQRRGVGLDQPGDDGAGAADTLGDLADGGGL